MKHCTIEIDGEIRIKALETTEKIAEGDIGGIIGEGVKLSQEGIAWIDYTSKVFGSIKIDENSVIGKCCDIKGRGEIINARLEFTEMDGKVHVKDSNISNALLKGGKILDSCFNSVKADDFLECRGSFITGSEFTGENSVISSAVHDSIVAGSQIRKGTVRKSNVSNVSIVNSFLYNISMELPYLVKNMRIWG